MPEIVKTYMLDNPSVMIPMERSAFYKEQIEQYLLHGKPSRAVEVVNIFLFNEKKQLLVQKRSDTKAHNPGLFDKSLGGHVQSHDTIDFTVLVETIQELEVPSILLRPENQDIEQSMKLLRKFIQTVAVIIPVNREITQIKKIIKGKEIVIANYTNIFVGLYGGRIRNSDSEAAGVVFYDFESLQKDIQNHTSLFTADIQLYIEQYKKEFTKFMWQIDELMFQYNKFIADQENG